jgi:hypothetical protein
MTIYRWHPLKQDLVNEVDSWRPPSPLGGLIRYAFEPRDDITAYELAVSMKFGAPLGTIVIDELSNYHDPAWDLIKRHWNKVL